MRKIRSLIAAFLVVLIQITPGPFGMRPAFAYGSVPGNGTDWHEFAGSKPGLHLYMRQPVAQNPTVDSSAKVSMPVETGYKFTDPAGSPKFVQSATGDVVQVDLTTGETKQFIKDNASNYPKTKAILDNSTGTPMVTDPGAIKESSPSGALPAIGQVIEVEYSNSNMVLWSTVAPLANKKKLKITSAWTLSSPINTLASTTRLNTFFAGISGQASIDVPSTLLGGSYQVALWYASALETTDPVTPGVPSDTPNPAKVVAGLNQAGFPTNQPLNGEIIGIAAGTGKGPSGGVKAGDLAALQAAGYNGAVGDGSIVSDGMPHDPSENPNDDSQDDKSNDPPYSPSPVGDPYPQDPTKIDFSKRMTDFFTSAKQSAIFSLPSSFSNIPGGSSTPISISAPSIYGQPISFDFSSMDYMWAILRTVNLSGFGYVAIRIVCLKH